MGHQPRKLTVIFDGDCVLCRRSVRWLDGRQTHVVVETVAAGDADAIAAYGAIPGYGDNMVVVADDGRSWVGPPDAYLVVMWAVRGTRNLSYLLSLPLLRGLTGRTFGFVAGNRHLLGGRGSSTCDGCVA